MHENGAQDLELASVGSPHSGEVQLLHEAGTHEAALASRVCHCCH